MVSEVVGVGCGCQRDRLISSCELPAPRSLAVVGAGRWLAAGGRKRSQPFALLYLSAVRRSALSGTRDRPRPRVHARVSASAVFKTCTLTSLTRGDSGRRDELGTYSA
jgi:hypothetical protein